MTNMQIKHRARRLKMGIRRIGLSGILCLLAVTTHGDVIAKTLWLEARGEGPRGLLMVATVIHNRMEDRRWPDTLDGVVLQRHQFSCWNGQDPSAKVVAPETAHDRAVWLVCRSISHQMQHGIFVPLGPWNHYYNPALANPSWGAKMREVRQHRSHLFGVL